MSDLEAMPIPGTESRQGVLNPVFSPDGRSIAFWVADDRHDQENCHQRRRGRDHLSRPSVLPGSPGTPAESCSAKAAKASCEWRRPAGNRRLWCASMTAKSRTVRRCCPTVGSVLFTVATGTSPDRWDKAKVVLQSLDSGERKTLIDGGSDGRFLPTGHIVYALGGTAVRGSVRPPTAGSQRRADADRRGRPTREHPRNQPGRRALQRLQHRSAHLCSWPRFADGAPIRSSYASIRKAALEPLKLPRGRYETPRVSPDGKRLAFGTEDAKEAIVWIYDLSGTSSMRRLTVGGRNRYPIWSADGERVAFQSDREGDVGIFWQRADGTGPAERLTRPEPGTFHVPESWSPKGDRFLFSAFRRRARRVSVDVFTSGQKGGTVWRRPVVQPQSSPGPSFHPMADGSRTCPMKRARPAVYVQPFPATGAKYPISRGRAFSPLWSPDGKDIVYVDTANPRAGRLVVVSLTTQPTFTFGNPVVVPSGTLQTGGVSAPNAPRRFDMAPDGAIIGTVESEQTLVRSARRPAHRGRPQLVRRAEGARADEVASASMGQLSLVNLPALHHEPHALQRRDVRAADRLRRRRGRPRGRRRSRRSIFSSPIDSAASDVMPTIASIGFWPALTRSIGSRAFWPCAPATASVPITIFRPGVLSAVANIALLQAERLLHRGEAFLGVVADAEEALLVLEIVLRDQADVRIEPDAALGQQLERLRRWRARRARRRCSRRARRASSIRGCARAPCERRPCARASPHAASSCSCDSVGVPPSRMLADAKILIRSAPSAFFLRMSSRI